MGCLWKWPVSLKSDASVSKIREGITVLNEFCNQDETMTVLLKTQETLGPLGKKTEVKTSPALSGKNW